MPEDAPVIQTTCRKCFSLNYIDLIETWLRKLQIVMLVQFPEWVMGHFKNMTIEIFKIATISSPVNFLRGFDNRSPQTPNLCKNIINFVFRFCIIGNRNSRKSRSFGTHGCIFSEVFSRVKRQHNSARGKSASPSTLAHDFFHPSLFRKISLRTCKIVYP